MNSMFDVVEHKLHSLVPTIDSISAEMKLQDDLHLSSLALVSLLTTLCDQFGVDLLKLTDADLLNLVSVEDVVNLFERYSSKS
ncbi:Phosphopantetheine attachment site [Thalassolituus maritimus]|uniref:Phosphopantetheine attachment site n=1 Tax=Thalassolituus maritimus TaxID=484498 RepID=A0A1N7QA07_9GAMM|nr:phosphopantetheine-binding protein [Thalassolituus maritimus]SIT19427.1 Phosphopantetheine attachment site [Thalassolituus maritimus]